MSMNKKKKNIMCAKCKKIHLPTVLCENHITDKRFMNIGDEKRINKCPKCKYEVYVNE